MTIDELIQELQKLRRQYGGDVGVLPYWVDDDFDFDIIGFGIIDETMTSDEFRLGQLGMFLLS